MDRVGRAAVGRELPGLRGRGSLIGRFKITHIFTRNNFLTPGVPCSVEVPGSERFRQRVSTVSNQPRGPVIYTLATIIMPIS